MAINSTAASTRHSAVSYPLVLTRSSNFGRSIRGSGTQCARLLTCSSATRRVFQCIHSHRHRSGMLFRSSPLFRSCKLTPRLCSGNPHGGELPPSYGAHAGGAVNPSATHSSPYASPPSGYTSPTSAYTSPPAATANVGASITRSGASPHTEGSERGIPEMDQLTYAGCATEGICTRKKACIYGEHGLLEQRKKSCPIAEINADVVCRDQQVERLLSDETEFNRFFESLERN